jgi:hypothetical protein
MTIQHTLIQASISIDIDVPKGKGEFKGAA